MTKISTFNYRQINEYAELFTTLEQSYSVSSLEGRVARFMNSRGMLTYSFLTAFGTNVRAPAYKEVEEALKKSELFSSDRRVKKLCKSYPLTSLFNPVSTPIALRSKGLNTKDKEHIMALVQMKIDLSDNSEAEQEALRSVVTTLIEPHFEMTTEENQALWRRLAVIESVFSLTSLDEAPFILFEEIQRKYEEME